MILTHEDLAAISHLVDSRLDFKLKPFEEKFDSIENRLDSIEGRLDSIESRLDSHDEKFASIERRLDSHDEKFASIERRLDSHDEMFASINYRLKRIEVDLLENNVIPRLNTLESCYMSTYDRYRNYAKQMEKVFDDVELLKGAVEKHSNILQAQG